VKSNVDRTLELIDKQHPITCAEAWKILGGKQKNLAGVFSYLSRSGSIMRTGPRNCYQYGPPVGMTAVEAHALALEQGIKVVKTRAKPAPVPVLGGVWSGLL